MKEDRFYRNYFIVLATIALIAMIYQTRTLITPVLTALIFAYILYPMVVGAHRLGIHKGLTIFAIFLLCIGSITYVAYSLIPAIKYEVYVISRPEQYRDVAQSRLVGIGKEISLQLKQIGLIRETWNDQKIIVETSSWIAEQSTTILKSFGGLARRAGQFFLIFFFVLVFSLLDGEKFYRSVVRMIPNSFFEPGLYILKKTIDILGYYLRGLVIENLILGVLSFALLVALTFFTELTLVLAMVIAFAIALTNVIRIIGPVIGAVFGVFLVLITSTDFVAILGIIGVVFIVQFLDNVLILPLVMQEQVEIHPVFCVLGVLMGGILAGALGMIVAIPVLGGIKVIYRIFVNEMKKFNMDPEPLSKHPAAA